MTCTAQLYYSLYERHAGRLSNYHNWRVRMARQLIEQHRKHCPVCRDDGLRTNFNAGEPRKVVRHKKGE